MSEHKPGEVIKLCHACPDYRRAHCAKRRTCHALGTALDVVGPQTPRTASQPGSYAVVTERFACPRVGEELCLTCGTPDWCKRHGKPPADGCDCSLCVTARSEAKKAAPRTAMLPADAASRKNAPIARGVLDYFPLAVAAVAELSRIGNEQHNPGQPMHWARGKSTDHADCIVRHLIDRGTLDSDGVRHATKVAWRALALLQTELEDAAKAPTKTHGD